MREQIPTLEDLPSNEANCATCTRQGGGCARTSNKNRQHNGLLYNEAGEVTGMIAKCINYTGRYE